MRICNVCRKVRDIRLNLSASHMWTFWSCRQLAKGTTYEAQFREGSTVHLLSGWAERPESALKIGVCFWSYDSYLKILKLSLRICVVVFSIFVREIYRSGVSLGRPAGLGVRPGLHIDWRTFLWTKAIEISANKPEFQANLIFSTVHEIPYHLIRFGIQIMFPTPGSEFETI